ncbi:hypothetical protein [Rubrivirga sp. IMCC45206]|uniref:hypothetical protein n=1 Tax=Rubrivirga sp. IMCC45206 TaxID=3391614 RepID=UPI00399038E2
MKDSANTYDPQTVHVRCATKGSDPYVYVEAANSGTVDGQAELIFKVHRDCADAKVTLVEVRAGDNCTLNRQLVSTDGQSLEADLGYKVSDGNRASLTYGLHYRDADGTLRQAYGGEPEGAVDDVLASGAGFASVTKASTPSPPPKVDFP